MLATLLALAPPAPATHVHFRRSQTGRRRPPGRHGLWRRERAARQRFIHHAARSFLQLLLSNQRSLDFCYNNMTLAERPCPRPSHTHLNERCTRPSDRSAFRRVSQFLSKVVSKNTEEQLWKLCYLFFSTRVYGEHSRNSAQGFERARGCRAPQLTCASASLQRSARTTTPTLSSECTQDTGTAESTRTMCAAAHRPRPRHDQISPVFDRARYKND